MGTVILNSELSKIDIITDSGPKKVYLFIKRFIDIILSSILILLSFPLMIFIAYLVSTTSKGPVILRQRRTGLNGSEFYLFRFRCLRIDFKPSDSFQFVHERKARYLFQEEYDPRITTIGRFIRRTGLDCLPMLFNVLKGNMSIIGPKPLNAALLAPYEKIKIIRTTVKPGLLGVWQLKPEKSNHTLIQMLSYDLDYISSASHHYDLLITLKSIPYILKRLLSI